MTGVLIGELEHHTSAVTCLVAGRSDDEVISAALDGMALLWDVTDRHEDANEHGLT